MILIAGGAHSDQCRDAESILNTFVSAAYIVTSWISDNQVTARIQHHRDTRLAHWRLEDGCQGFFAKLLRG
ncbi:bifunctional adenosylcobinamide kinase/adenosylcobinamide-phosphate guanylyltransferase [Klebsiella sp. RHBSTW-00484]|uniref:bifunctional adenosylcobinamide kinase/adenosylcobinamide-phosphate guanylyltransferase n=1 Tax=unclassified Klebsiella TaxID=2608929 RepID=UPI0015E49E45|nr:MULTISPECIES: bifunctional adenosylcobinamide kinase/adenosylcobinamide-phosphate guanylyltransferase [unclassified Klebsiella]QLO36281.1 bifunctional adenosylcobinamide kinase/adenosylcobinamide-phosphate guanylyltransferase [Klebsiella sp. RHBSTW-00484]QLT75798.1 bifunctional adenosylcobinamide kinase/adenosylcobinamide-phosphate guanylyltransferase [Klebsiella sp. RHBSTW-00464]